MSDRLNILATGRMKEFYASSASVSGSSDTVTSVSTTNLTVGMKVTGHSNLQENTFIKNIDSSSQITLSKATTGSIATPIKFTPVNYDVPTNPHINLAKTLSSTDRIFTGIFADDTNGTIRFNEVGTSTSNKERENLATTEGYRIKCYNSATDEGVQLIDATNHYSASAFSLHHYFVLLHSDNSSLHHFARVTEVLKGDVDGD